jgi:hypothetical protein
MRLASRTTNSQDREILGGDELPEVDDHITRSGDNESLSRVVQAKMAVSSPTDSYEIEAERVADEFVSRSYDSTGTEAPEIHDSNAHQISRRITGGGLASGEAGLETTDQTASEISRATSGGVALDTDTRGRFEAGLGADLSRVRIHADGQSDKLCRSLSAQAFTTGSDVFFSSGQFQPGTKTGDHLLAHELTHVVQQGSTPVVSRFSLFGKSESAKKADEMRKQREAQKNAFMLQAITQQEVGESLDDDKDDDADSAYAFDEIYGPNSQPHEITNQSREIDSVKNTGESTSNPGGLDQADGIVGLASTTKGLIEAILALYRAIKSEETDGYDVAEAAAQGVSKALSLSEAAVKTAVAFGGTVGSAAVPGIGIAVSTISAAQEIVNIWRANRDIKAMVAERDATTDVNKQLAANNLISRRKRSFYGAIVNLIGDITMLIGNIGVVATGPGAPWALIVVASGALVKAFSAIGQAISRWVEANYTNKARAEMASAKDQLKNAKTDDEKAAAKKRLEAAEQVSLQDDAAYAAKYILEKATEMRTPEGKYDPKALQIIKAYGLDQKWMDDYWNSNKSPVIFEKGVDQILATAGTTRNPRGFVDSLKATGKALAGYFVSFWNFITGKKVIDGASPEMSPIRIKIRAEDAIFNEIVPVLAKYSDKKPPVASKLNEKFTKIYKALMAAFAPEGYMNKKKAEYNAEIIKAAAIELLLKSDAAAAIEPGSIDIKDAKYEFKVKRAA